MRELIIDFITTLDGYASGDGWPGWWGLEGPEYLAWLSEQPPVTYLMGAKTYRLMYGFAGGETAARDGVAEAEGREAAAGDPLQRMVEGVVGVVEDNKEGSAGADDASQFAEGMREVSGDFEVIEGGGGDDDVEGGGGERERADVGAKTVELAADMFGFADGGFLDVDADLVAGGGEHGVEDAVLAVGFLEDVGFENVGGGACGDGA